MNTTTLVLIVVAALVLFGLVALVWSRKRRSAVLQDRFGSEYGRAVEQFGDRKRAEAELAARQKKFQKAEIRELSDADRERYAQLWQKTQARFVDGPAAAVAEADRLIEEVMRARGYPVGDFTQRMADVAVGHPHLAEHYRSACELARRSEGGKAGTEELRQALVHYRALFEDLLQARPAEVASR